MTEQEKSLSSLLLGNYAQQMINQSRIPVLTVRPKDVQATNANY
jgi:nucleotide-binding universal stress UspA family protein